MIGDVWLFVLSLFGDGILLFLTVYVVITLSDLECDYLNAQECCRKLNGWIEPEMIFHGIITLFLLIEWHWLLFFINLPMACWQAYKKFTVPSGNFGIYDPTEIHNRFNLKQHMRDSLIRLAFYLIFFFVYLYCMIISLLMKSPENAPSEEF
ncbi:protein cornichon homolog 4-like [Uloborus diversus]|uniref:protein cornichon homolog 4-like n=1 Tax=Uloborus diversus TaxID=327109 RepID=UPI00240A85EB|nr:protein cornichon homolog 4-like [Uloborus diversus]